MEPNAEYERRVQDVVDEWYDLAYRDHGVRIGVKERNRLAALIVRRLGLGAQDEASRRATP